MTTLAAVAPPVKAMGIPPISAQGPPQRLLDTERTLPPVPAKATSAPETLSTEPPERLRRGPEESVSVLPLARVTRSPETFSTLPPERAMAAPLATVSRLASRARGEPSLETLLLAERLSTALAAVSWAPRRMFRIGRLASSSAVSTRRTPRVISVAPSRSSRVLALLSGRWVASLSPVSASFFVRPSKSRD